MKNSYNFQSVVNSFQFEENARIVHSKSVIEFSNISKEVISVKWLLNFD
jgi:hypothetical protein